MKMVSRYISVNAIHLLQIGILHLPSIPFEKSFIRRLRRVLASGNEVDLIWVSRFHLQLPIGPD